MKTVTELILQTKEKLELARQNEIKLEPQFWTERRILRKKVLLVSFNNHRGWLN